MRSQTWVFKGYRYFDMCRLRWAKVSLERLVRGFPYLTRPRYNGPSGPGVELAWISFGDRRSR